MKRKKYVLFRENTSSFRVNLKTKISKTDLLRSLKCLNNLWQKGLKPEDLNKHYFLTWMAVTNGIIARQAKALHMHRNSIIGICGKIGLGTRTYRFRRIWLKVLKKAPNKPFHLQVHILYRKVVKTPSLKPIENRNLVRLWLMGFPLKVLLAHFVLWAFRKGYTRLETAKKLGTTRRTLNRLIVYGSTHKSSARIWFTPLKPRRKDWRPNWASHQR